MSVEIVTVGGEKRASLLEDSLGRVLTIGSDWTKLAFLARFQCEDFGSNPGSPTPICQLGVMVAPTALMANSPRGSLCPHFIGVDSGTTAWTRNAGGYYTGPSQGRIKKILGTRTSSGGNGTVIAYNGNRQVFAAIITKAAVNWTIDAVYPNSLSAADAILDVDGTDSQLKTVVEQGHIGSSIRDACRALAGSSSSYSSTSSTIAIDEATNGYFTSLVFTWNRSDLAMRVCDLMWFKHS